mmetsp:Transcript_10029/g.21930  ORF Transcript_10029/g.21930 Transcript_10029/m.21930 type:complete len:124 (+) Transcript_10029:122-493(+)
MLMPWIISQTATGDFTDDELTIDTFSQVDDDEAFDSTRCQGGEEEEESHPLDMDVRRLSKQERSCLERAMEQAQAQQRSRQEQMVLFRSGVKAVFSMGYASTNTTRNSNLPSPRTSRKHLRET